MIPCYHSPVSHKGQGNMVNENYPYALFLFGDDPEHPTGEGRMCAMCQKVYVINLSLQKLVDTAVAKSGVVKTGVGDIQMEI